MLVVSVIVWYLGICARRGDGGWDTNFPVIGFATRIAKRSGLSQAALGYPDVREDTCLKVDLGPQDQAMMSD